MRRSLYFHPRLDIVRRHYELSLGVFLEARRFSWGETIFYVIFAGAGNFSGIGAEAGDKTLKAGAPGGPPVFIFHHFALLRTEVALLPAELDVTEVEAVTFE